MANMKRKHFLTLTRPQLIALAVQKGVAPYCNAIDKTKGQLVALLCDVEGVLTPVKTWASTDDAPGHDDTGIQYRQSEYLT